MIDSRIFQHGATSINIAVTKWKSDKTTPMMYSCTIKTDTNSPDSVVAERDSAAAAERECVERFISLFEKRKRGIHDATKIKRVSGEVATPKQVAPEKALPDAFEY